MRLASISHVARAAALSLLLPGHADAPPTGTTGTTGTRPAATPFTSRGVTGCFLVVDAETGAELHVVETPDSALCDRALPPASTFKIPNTLIGIDAGVLTGPEQRFPWDGVERRVASWNRDQTLESAFRESALWVYQDVARRVGREPCARHLASEGYGNADVGGPDELATFWLDGTLLVTPRGQAAWLRRLARGEVAFSERAQGVVRAIGSEEREDGSTLFTKTGWARTGDGDRGREVGWQVGWVERDGRTSIFVLAFSAPRGFDVWRERRAMLAELFLAHGLD